MIAFTVYCNIGISGQKLFIILGKYLIERMPQHFFQHFLFQKEQFFVTIPEHEINSGSVFVENKLDHAKGKGHVIQYGETCTDIGGCNFGKLMTQSLV